MPHMAQGTVGSSGMLGPAVPDDQVLKKIDWRDKQCLMWRKALSETFDTLGLKAPDEQPMAQVLQIKASLSYMLMLTVDNRW